MSSSLATEEQNKLDKAIDLLVLLRSKLESRGEKARASRVISILEEIADAHDVQLTLIDIFPEDGEMPDEEHLLLLEAYKLDEDLNLDPLNEQLAKCKRPARAEITSDEDEDYDDDLEALTEANDEVATTDNGLEADEQ